MFIKLVKQLRNSGLVHSDGLEPSRLSAYAPQTARAETQILKT